MSAFDESTLVAEPVLPGLATSGKLSDKLSWRRTGGTALVVIRHFYLRSKCKHVYFYLSMVNKDVGRCGELDQLRIVETAWS